VPMAGLADQVDHIVPVVADGACGHFRTSARKP
jgi:hypothetical protein